MAWENNSQECKNKNFKARTEFFYETTFSLVVIGSTNVPGDTPMPILTTHNIKTM